MQQQTTARCWKNEVRLLIGPLTLALSPEDGGEGTPTTTYDPRVANLSLAGAERGLARCSCGDGRVTSFEIVA